MTMRILTTAILAAACVASAGTSAFAGDTARITDAQFIKVARCSGLAAAATVGGDKSVFDSLMRAQRRGREAFVLQRADNAQNEAERQARKAGDVEKATLSAEMAGACATLAG